MKRFYCDLISVEGKKVPIIGTRNYHDLSETSVSYSGKDYLLTKLFASKRSIEAWINCPKDECKSLSYVVLESYLVIDAYEISIGLDFDDNGINFYIDLITNIPWSEYVKRCLSSHPFDSKNQDIHSTYIFRYDRETGNWDLE